MQTGSFITSCRYECYIFIGGIKWLCSTNKKGLYADGATIKDVIFNAPATIVKWSDGSKTVVKCQEGDTYNPELGLAMCVVKKCCGNKGNFNDVFKKWLPKEGANNVKKTKEKCL